MDQLLSLYQRIAHVKAYEDNALITNLLQRIHRVDLYQITIFCNTSATQSVTEERILRRIIPIWPTALVDLSKVPQHNSSFSKMPAFVYPKDTNFYLVLLTQLFYTGNIHLRQLQVLLDLLVNLSPRTIRPRTLLVYLEPDAISRNALNPMFRYAWFNKFLDFSIIVLRPDRKADIFHYNAFTQTRNNEEFTNATSIFLDKLYNMRGYVIKAPFLDMPPHMSAEPVNQSLVYAKEAVSPACASLELDSLSKSDYHLLPVPLYAMDFELALNEVERGKTYFSEKLGVMVSTTVIHETPGSFTTLIYLLLEIFPLIAFVSLTRCLGFMNLGIREIIHVTLSQTTKQPRDAASRIFFIVIIFLSLCYFSNIVAKITEIHVKDLEVPLATSSDVVASGLIPHISDRLHSVYFDNIDESFDTLKSKLVIVKSLEKCVKQIFKREKNACFMLDSAAMWFLDTNVRKDGCPKLRFNLFEFFSIGRALYFERGLPFVEKFNQMIQRVIDSGIKNTCQEKLTKRNVCYDDIMGELNIINQRHLLNKLFMIMVYGYAMSAMIFLFELLYKHFDSLSKSPGWTSFSLLRFPKMFAILYFLVSIVNKQVLVTAKEDWIETLVSHIQQLQPYQLTVIRNSSVANSIEEDLVVHQLSTTLPTALIDLAKVNTTSGASMLSMPAFGYPRRSTIYLVLLSRIFYTENIHLRQLQYLIDFLINLSARTMRPRCLLVYLRSESIPQKWLQPVLHYAWHKRFLDFSIVRLDSACNAYVHRYNPFALNYDQEDYASDTQLFPDKLTDMKGYAMRVPFIYMPPFMDVDVENKKFTFSGSGIDLLRDYAKALNYTINIIIIEKMPIESLKIEYLVHKSSVRLGEMIRKSVIALSNNEFDMLPIPLYPTSSALKEEDIEKSKAYIYDNFGVSVSISAFVQKKKVLDALAHFLITICSMFIFIGLGYVLRKISFLKLQPDSFGYFVVITLSLGQWYKPPQRSSERIVFFCVIVLSLTHFSDIFAKITENHVKSFELPLSTAEDVIKSGYTPKINDGYHIIYFKELQSDPRERDSSYQALASRLKIIKRIQNCFDSVANNEKAVCFTTKYRASWYVKNNEKPGGCPLVRFSDFEFLSVRMALYFEKGSPYVDKFNRLLQSFIDFGIFEFWERELKYKSACLEGKRRNLNTYNSNSLRRQLVLIMLYGYGSSSCEKRRNSSPAATSSACGEMASVSRLCTHFFPGDIQSTFRYEELKVRIRVTAKATIRKSSETIRRISLTPYFL
ncbi:hypothetical protein TSAR_011029 [Trichomalopsis sarcophagae]|uniref:Ionotropic glutamate receptor C-terminal domain-containing protein n=1 Tax=Trichomalopsis sarcophagae TaxID=543379 RepID=A0A232FKK4_9HYME|nr:hypothetical protein TSAR_011029 [Trichomalopsis sarcophagae]